MEEVGFDSLWLPDVLSLPVDDPLVGLAYAAGSVSKLKLGTTLVLPGRNVVRLARQLSTLDRVSDGRLLVTVVAGLRRQKELAAMGVSAGEREGQLDDMLPLLRRLLTEDDEPKPIQDPFDIWVGGIAPSALERAAAMSDGWLPSLCTPDEAGRGRAQIEQRAGELGRRIDPEHFGVSIGYLPEAAPSSLVERVAARRPGVDPDQIVPLGLASLRHLIQRFIEAGMSKFVVRPVVPDKPWDEELDLLAAAVLDLQN